MALPVNLITWHHSHSANHLSPEEIYVIFLTEFMFPYIKNLIEHFLLFSKKDKQKSAVRIFL